MNPTPAVVLGMSLTGLAVIRSLAKRNIPVIGIDYDSQAIAFRSALCEKHISPRPQSEIHLFLDFLDSLARSNSTKLALIPTTDEFVLAISRNREKLQPKYKFILPDKRIVETINNKRLFYNWADDNGYDIPSTYTPNNFKDVLSISEQIQYPCIIKPAFPYHQQTERVFANSKALLIYTETELYSVAQDLEEVLPLLILQEIVKGPDHYQYSLGAFISTTGKQPLFFLARKVRQRPPGFGVGTFVITCDSIPLKNLALSILTSLNYAGIAELEFKIDKRDNKIKLIEINSRPWIQISLPEKKGQNYLYYYYSEAIDTPYVYSPQNRSRYKIGWLHLEHDLYATFGKNGYFSKNKHIILDWIKSLFSVRVLAVLSLSDIYPSLYSLKTALRTLMTKFVRHSRIRRSPNAVI